MKKLPLLNQPISAVIAAMGHTDTLVIADAGLPIPPDTQRIDLALKAGTPSLLETVKTILTEMRVQSVMVAQEMVTGNHEMYVAIREIFDGVPILHISHELLKQRTKEARAVVRTGECTRYANIILVSGVVF